MFIHSTLVCLYRCGDVTFFPGNNVIEDKAFDEIKGNPLLKKRFETGELVLKAQAKNVIVEAGEEVAVETEELAEGISDLNSKDAKLLIKETYDRDSLELWLSQETRSGVESAIKSRIEDLSSKE